MKNYIRKADIILFVVLMAVGLAVSAYFALSGTVGSKVLIESNGELYGKYSLYEDRVIQVKDGAKSNKVVIADGEVYVEKASCQNQVCVKTGHISRSGESIICLPNKMVVRIEGNGGGKYDAVSN